ncbi:MAG: hypothetical protein ABIJ33_00180 [Patescibacteria group bacterium]
MQKIADTKKTEKRLVSYIEDLESKLDRTRQVLFDQGFLRQFQSNFSQQIESLRGQSDLMRTKLQELKTAMKEAELMYMPFEQLAKLAVEMKADPFEFAKLRAPSVEPYKFAIAKAAQIRLLGSRKEEDNSAQNRERETWKVWMQLSFMGDKLQVESEKACSSKTAPVLVDQAGGKKTITSLEDALSSHLVVREELMRVLAHDRKWGNDFKALIKGAIIQAALKNIPSEMNAEERANLPTLELAKANLLANNREREPVMTKRGQVVLFDKRFYVYDPSFSYEALSNVANGRAQLERFMNNFCVNPEAPQDEQRKAHEMAIEFAKKVYITFTLLDDSFVELQSSTQTRSHNGNEPDNLIIHKPLSVSVHRVDRYDRSKDWSQLIWAYYKRNNVPEYFWLSDPVKEEMLERIDAYEEYQNVLFDTPFFNSLEFPKFLEFLFPTPRALTELQKGEYIWVAGCLPETEGYIPGEEKREYLVDCQNKVIAQRTDDGQVFLADGRTKIGQIREGVSGGSNEGGAKSFTFEAGQTASFASVRIPVAGVEGGVKLAGDSNERDLYYIAASGLEQALKITFAALPAQLSSSQILDSIQSGKSGALNEMFSAWGQAKMFPFENLDKLITPILGHYVFRLIAAYHDDTPERRRFLLTEMFNRLGRSSKYGGLSRKNLSEQITKILSYITITNGERQKVGAYRNISLPKWGDGGTVIEQVSKDAANSIRPYKDYRDKQLIQFLKTYWQREHPGEPMPPIGEDIGSTTRISLWKKSQRARFRNISQAQEDLISQSQWKKPLPEMPIDRDVKVLDFGDQNKGKD